MPIPALTAYKTQINTDITTQSATDSISPTIVGSGYTDLVDIIEPYLEFDEGRVYSAGSTVPSALDGSNGDVYFYGQTSGVVTIYQKVLGAWVASGSFTIDVGGVTLTGTTDTSGNYDASATGTAKLIAVYEGNVLVRPEYNKSTKLLSAMNPSTAFTAYFI